MSDWHAEVWIRIRDISIILPLSLFRVKNHVCLSRVVQVEGVAWQAAMRIVVWVGDLVQRTGMVKHRSGNRWPDDRAVRWCCVRSTPCTSRRGVRVSWFSLKTKIDGLSVVWPQNHWDGFSSLDLKTGSYGLVIWGSKSPRRFLGLGLKTKRVMVFRLRHKTDGMMKTA
jgi:hypothetical protein